MKNPNTNRTIMFGILFLGFAVFGAGNYCSSGLIGAAGLALVIAASAWGIIKVRCPYCGKLLSLKITHDVKCPYCGKFVDH